MDVHTAVRAVQRMAPVHANTARLPALVIVEWGEVVQAAGGQFCSDLGEPRD